MCFLIKPLKNEINKPLYLVCGVDVLNYDDYIPVRANYGSFKEEVEARKKNQIIDENGDVRDTIKLIIPTTKERFQVNHKGEKIDVFKTLSNLQEVFNNRQMSFTVPIPPDDSVLIKGNYVDVDLHKLLQRENIVIEETDCSFCGQTVILEPYGKKSFSIDLSYLLLRKATYQIIFDFRADNKLFKKETSFLKHLGFHRFKGQITSNSLNVVSE